MCLTIYDINYFLSYNLITINGLELNTKLESDIEIRKPNIYKNQNAMNYFEQISIC